MIFTYSFVLQQQCGNKWLMTVTFDCEDEYLSWIVRGNLCKLCPFTPNLTISLLIFISTGTGSKGNARTIIKAFGLTVSRGDVVTFFELESMFRYEPKFALEISRISTVDAGFWFSSFYNQDLGSINSITTRRSPREAFSPEFPAHTGKSEGAGYSPAQTLRRSSQIRRFGERLPKNLMAFSWFSLLF